MREGLYESFPFEQNPSMKFTVSFLVLFALVIVFYTAPAARGQAADPRIDALEQRVSHLEHSTNTDGAASVAVFICGAFCALWAQQTGRNAWAWFFLGIFFSVITLIVLLHKNSEDKKRGG
jgi:Na+/melibiose symporter-like transporter